MSKYLYLCLMLMFAFSVTCIAQNKNATNAVAINAKALKLKNAYRLAVTSTNKKKYEAQFFNEFPNTFKELNELYGYENDKPAPLYHDAVKHIKELFNNIKSVNDTVYYQKIASIAKNARWDADAISYFQDGLQKRVASNSTLTLFILRNKPDKEVTSFWAFYFDYEDSTIRKEEYASLSAKISAINKKAVRMVAAGYMQSINRWKNSH
jgi:hypothetical protein